MKKILAVLAATMLLCSACEPSNEQAYIAQLEQRITGLEQQINALKENIAETPMPQAAPSSGEAKKESVPSLQTPQLNENPDAQASVNASSPAVSDSASARQTAQETAQSAADQGSVIVYITKSGTKYHKKGCASLTKSCIPISLEEAIAKGYKPCGRCNPP